MSGAKQPSILPAFSERWVGGDIHGLSDFAGTLYGYIPEINAVITALDRRVNGLVQAGGWSGAAASSFAQAWETDSAGASALGVVMTAIGDAVDALAVGLANLEHALEAAADEARAQGVRIGADGRPPAPVEGPVAVGSAAANIQATGNEYSAFWQQTMALAQDARTDAATEFEGIYSQVAPSSAGSGNSAVGDAGNEATIADYLRGFWAIPSAYRKVVQSDVEDLSEAADKAKAAWVAARDARPNPRVPMPQNVKDNLHDARSELAAAEKDLDSAEAAEGGFPLSKLLDYRIGDLKDAVSELKGSGLEDAEGQAAPKSGGAGVAEGAGTADGADDGFDSLLTKLADFGEDIPIIDVAAAGLGTVLGSIQEIDSGKPWYEAVPESALANVGGLAAGAAAGALVGGAVAGLSFVGAPVAAVVAGAAVGGVVAIGVSDLATNLFDENWNAEIHDHGVASGVYHGTLDSLHKTGDELGGLATSAWHGVTSIF